MALSTYLSYRTDHLAQKWHGNLITDELDKLYCMLKNKIDNPSEDPAVDLEYLALAQMTAEGIGCVPDPESALKYCVKAKELFDAADPIHLGLDEFNGFFDFDLTRFLRLLSSNVKAKPYTET